MKSTLCATTLGLALLLGACSTKTKNALSSVGLLTSAETAFTPARGVLERNCVHCHGDNRLSTMPPIQSTRGIENLITGGWIVPEKPQVSRFYQVMTLPDTAPGAMPPTGHAVSKEEAQIIHDWIKAGARIPSKNTKLVPQGKPPRSV
ncbi:MAG: hypothetical protein IPK32_18140 [Verrucomicrobiaceae bacterium]|nr:hypothetical protein [Verrucomicrobiaceae bacterium]